MAASSCTRMGEASAAASRASSKVSACLKNSISSKHSRRISARDAALGSGRLLVPALRVCLGCSAEPPLKYLGSGGQKEWGRRNNGNK